MNGGRRHSGPRHQLSARAPVDRSPRTVQERSVPVDASPGNRTRAAYLPTSTGSTTAQSFLPSAEMANAFLEARVRAKQRAERSNMSPDSLQYLRAGDVCRLLRISKPTLWRLRRTRGFPEPTEVTSRLIAWRRAEVEEWLRQVAASRRRPITAPTERPPVTEDVAPSPTPDPAKARATRAPRKRARHEP